MSNHKDNTDNRKLKDLLDKNKNPENSQMDDFDKEALEGFAMLENDEEILALKNKLDTKIYAGVFTEEKKPVRAYWYAAAGLLLIIGFSIYFLQNSPVSKNENLAIQSEKVENKDEIQKSIEAQTKKNESLQFKQAENLDEKPAAPGKKVPAEEEAYNYKSLSNKKAEEALLSESKESNAAPMYEQEPAASQAAPVVNEWSRSDDKKIRAQPKGNVTDQEDEKDRVVQNEEIANDAAPNSKNDIMISTTESKNKKSSKREKEKSEVSFSPPPAAIGTGAASGPASYYTGGENALNKELKNNLSAKNLLQKFDATLFINEKRKVEKVVFTNAYDLTKSQQKQVSEILKQLDKFNVSPNVSGQILTEYKLVFRP